ncbi:MAG TPA: hypothetical protein VGY56_05145 [Verrucomicrobiae bacterium]|nr:hypothetical protein [Verrucomicrobiae bacterium]
MNKGIVMERGCVREAHQPQHPTMGYCRALLRSYSLPNAASSFLSQPQIFAPLVTVA